MSLLSPDYLDVSLFPDRLELTRSLSGFRRSYAPKQVVNFPAAQLGGRLWQPAVDVLASQVAAGALAKANVNLILSNHFVHYAVVPWSEKLGSNEEEQAFARHCFARVYGSQADAWTIKLASSKHGQPRLACAVEQPLVEALSTCMSSLAGRYRSLMPRLMASFNSWHTRVDKRPTWLVVVDEPGLLCLAQLQDGYWQSVRSIKVAVDWISELPSVLAREECLLDSQTTCEELLIFASDAVSPMVIESGKWRTNELVSMLLADKAAGFASQFSSAVGV